MKRAVSIVVLSCVMISLYAQDWSGISVPADAGTGHEWKLVEEASDDFNYEAPADNKGDEFNSKWIDFYHNTWTGPGLTVWDREHILVTDGLLQIPASRHGTNKIHTGCMTGKTRVQWPVFVEAKVKISNSVLASDVWLLSPDDTQEIDICEAYGATYSAGTGTDQSWFAERIHLSNHVFIRSPFQDYQPRDSEGVYGTWYKENGRGAWKNHWIRIGVYWRDPWHLEYYIDGLLVRTVDQYSYSYLDPAGNLLSYNTTFNVIDKYDYTNGTGLNKEMDIIINVEDQDWRSNQNLTPTDAELENVDNHTFKVDWIRVYKPAVASSISTQNTSEISVYPNPIEQAFQLSSDRKIKTVNIYTINGKLVHSEHVNGQSKKIHSESLTKGIYLLKVDFEDGISSWEKLVKA